MFQPYEQNGDGDSQRMLTSMEKITELQQLLDEKNLELDEMKVEIGNQQSKTSSDPTAISESTRASN